MNPLRIFRGVAARWELSKEGWRASRAQSAYAGPHANPSFVTGYFNLRTGSTLSVDGFKLLLKNRALKI